MLYNIYQVLVKFGVNCFIIITGYFLIDSKFNRKKLLKLIGEVLFYSWTILIGVLILTNQKIDFKSILRCVFPVTYSHYWFVTNYVILYLLSNYINKFLLNLTQREYRTLMIILLVIWCIIPSVLFGKIGFSNLDWFILLYMIGAYIKNIHLK